MQYIIKRSTPIVKLTPPVSHPIDICCSLNKPPTDKTIILIYFNFEIIRINLKLVFSNVSILNTILK